VVFDLLKVIYFDSFYPVDIFYPGISIFIFLLDIIINFSVDRGFGGNTCGIFYFVKLWMVLSGWLIGKFTCTGIVYYLLWVHIPM
jgi:hypothetical protein